MFHCRMAIRPGNSTAGAVSPGAAACYAAGMDAVAPWLTPALLVALFAWLRLDIRELRRDLSLRIDRTEKRIDDLAKDFGKRFDEVNRRFDEINKRFEEVNKRFDDITRELADLRERMAKLEGSLEGFLAGRRDRDAA